VSGLSNNGRRALLCKETATAKIAHSYPFKYMKMNGLKDNCISICCRLMSAGQERLRPGGLQMREKSRLFGDLLARPSAGESEPGN
jgi:hypothetical protein